MKKMRMMPIPPVIVRPLYTFIVICLGVTNFLIQSDAHDIWAPTATGAFIGGVTGGARGAAIGGAVGYGVGSITHVSRERHRISDDCYNEIRYLRSENRELRSDIKMLNRDTTRLERKLEKAEARLNKCQQKLSTRPKNQVSVRKSFSIME